MIRIIGAFLLVMVPAVAGAQNFGSMSQADMQKIMQQAQQMQDCMSKVDQAELKAMEQRSQQMETEFKALCAEGKRDQAQDKAIAYSREMADNPALQQIQACGEKYGSMMPGEAPIINEDIDYSTHHVCDE